MIKILVAVALLAVLGACTNYTLVKAEKQEIAGVYSVEPQIQWSRASIGKIDLWTVDGPGLQAVRFYKGLKNGDTLLTPAPGQTAEKLPEFKSDMRANEVMELVVDSIARDGAGEVKAAGLRPVEFGSSSGFRFDLTFLSSDGLAMQGTAAGSVIDGILHLILYTGASTHYYPKHKDAVDRIISSIEMI